MGPYSYKYGERTIEVGSDEWEFDEWRSAQVRGPTIRPLNGHIVVLVDKSPTRTGLIYHTENTMDHVGIGALVLDTSEAHGSPPVVIDRQGRRRKTTTGFRPGDRIMVVRFAGFGTSPRDAHERLRVMGYGEALGVEV